MSDNSLTPGTRVRFKRGAMGTIHIEDPYRFTEYIASEGDAGEVYSSPGAMPEGWLLVKLDEKDDDGRELFSPVHPMMVEAE